MDIQALLKKRRACVLSLGMLLILTGQWRGVSGLYAIRGQDCETSDGGQVSYYACLADTENLVYNGNARSSITVSPPGYTCGSPRERACPMDGGPCYFCDADSPTLSHPPSYMIDFNTNAITSPNMGSYWQSISWRQIYPKPLEVEVSLNFDQLYELQTNIIFTFASARPTSAILEKSRDFGATWTTWQRFNANCAGYLRHPNITAVNPDAVICTEEYSELLPYENGTVVFDILNDRYALFVGPNNDNIRQLSEALDEERFNVFLTFTNIRLRLLAPAKNWIGVPNMDDQLKSYYAVSHIQVEAHCSCNLHGRSCLFDESLQTTVCRCRHNTMGKNCEQCLPLYNNQPWLPGSYMPYPQGTANECQKCQCHDHADSCVYDASIGRGACVGCQHNTVGSQCEECLPGFYLNVSLPANHPNKCTACQCEGPGVAVGNLVCRGPFGQCVCKPLMTGLHCDTCIDQYYGLMIEPTGTCKACSCNLDGTVGRSNICDKKLGQCKCKPNICGEKCDHCCDGFYFFPAGSGSSIQDCVPCDCDMSAALNTTCDKNSGQCLCENNMSGLTCSTPVTGHYLPALDNTQLQPVSGDCKLDTDLLSPSFPFSGRYYAYCKTGDVLVLQELEGGSLQQPSLKWEYSPVLRYNLEGPKAWDEAALSVRVSGTDTNVNLSQYLLETDATVALTCPHEPDTLAYEHVVTSLPPGVGEAVLATDAVTLDVRCNYITSLTLRATSLNASDVIVIDSVALIPDHNASLAYAEADNATQLMYLECTEGLTRLRTRAATLANDTCLLFFTRTMAQLTDGSLACDCDPTGTVEDITCSPTGGQCRCKPGAYGRRCDVCEPGFYNFSDNGCILCPYLPCPGNDEEIDRDDTDASSGVDTTMIALIIVIIIFLVLILVLICFLSRRKYRNRVFKKCSRPDNLSYINVDVDAPAHHSPDIRRRADIGPEGLADVDEHLDFTLQRNTDDVRRSDSIKSNEPIIYKGTILKKNISRQNGRQESKQKDGLKGSMNSMYFDNQAFDDASSNTQDNVGKNGYQGEKVTVTGKQKPRIDKAERERYNMQLAQQLSDGDVEKQGTHIESFDEGSQLLQEKKANKSKKKAKHGGDNIANEPPIGAHVVLKAQNGSPSKLDEPEVRERSHSKLPDPATSLPPTSKQQTEGRYSTEPKNSSKMVDKRLKDAAVGQTIALPGPPPNPRKEAKVTASHRQLPDPRNTAVQADTKAPNSLSDGSGIVKDAGRKSELSSGSQGTHGHPLPNATDLNAKNVRPETLLPSGSRPASREQADRTYPDDVTSLRGRQGTPNQRIVPQPLDISKFPSRPASAGGRKLPQPSTEPQSKQPAPVLAGKAKHPGHDEQESGQKERARVNSLSKIDVGESALEESTGSGHNAPSKTKVDQSKRGSTASPGGRTLPPHNADKSSRGRTASPGGRTLPQPNGDQTSRGRTASPGGRTLPQPNGDKSSRGRTASPGGRTLPQPNADQTSRGRTASPGGRTLPQPNTDQTSRERTASPRGRTLPQPNADQTSRGRTASPGGRTLPQPNADQTSRGRTASPGGRTLPQPNADQASRGRTASPGGRTLPQPNADQTSRGRTASPGGRTLPQPNADQTSRGRTASPGGRTLPQPNADQTSRGRTASPGGRTLPQPNADQTSRGRIASPGGRTLPQPNADKSSRGRTASPGGRTLPQPNSDRPHRGNTASPGGRTLPEPTADNDRIKRPHGRVPSPGGRNLPQPHTAPSARGRTQSPAGRKLPDPKDSGNANKTKEPMLLPSLPKVPPSTPSVKLLPKTPGQEGDSPWKTDEKGGSIV